MPTFLRVIEMSPGDDRRMAVRPEHRAYVQDLYEQGRIKLSGPFADDTGAYMLYDAADETAARALVNADPYVREGVVREVSLREWKIVTPPPA